MLTQWSRRRARAGVTMVELVMALVVGGALLSVVARVALRQQRIFVALTEDAALAGQLRDAASMLPADVRGASVVAGDLREATDTSIEVRATVATAVGCDTVGSALVLAPRVPGAESFAGAVAPIQVGDTAWLLMPDDSLASWSARRVASVGATPAGQCMRGVGPRLGGAALGVARVTISLDSAPPATMLVGRPVRITRPIRYSLYRSSDASWNLGARDWNGASSRFNTIQPIAGPFQAPSTSAPAFQWFDSSGARLAAPVTSRDRVAWLRISLRGQTRDVDRVLGASSDTGTHRDSVSVVVSTRNRR